MALSLSLCDAGAPGRGEGGGEGGGVDFSPSDERRLGDDGVWSADQAGPPAEAAPHALSYEALVQLEDVRPVATSAEVSALPLAPFDAAAHGGADARCPICLDPLAGDEADDAAESEQRRLLLLLPCGHAMHAACGRGYLTRWSKRCAEVHCRRSVRPCDADERNA